MAKLYMNTIQFINLYYSDLYIQDLALVMPLSEDTSQSFDFKKSAYEAPFLI